MKNLTTDDVKKAMPEMSDLLAANWRDFINDLNLSLDQLTKLTNLSKRLAVESSTNGENLVKHLMGLKDE